MDGDRPGRGVEAPQVATSAELRAGSRRVENCAYIQLSGLNSASV